MRIFNRLLSALRRLPGVGPRQAERFVSYFLKASQSEAEEFISALRELKTSIKMCRHCHTYCEKDICRICSDPGRDKSLLCVVEEPQDVETIEKTGAFNGLYHVLHGSLSPIDGVNPESIKISSLSARLNNGHVIKEIIIATDPDTEGEATALYIAELLRGRIPKITRIAYGVPLGGDLDYTDEFTLTHAIAGRTKI
ncbi:MAG: recombination mediator RecR [Elusimicrobia bacterium]|nr:recombination mediator RecR [Elusimicrobiota bacterium]